MAEGELRMERSSGAEPCRIEWNNEKMIASMSTAACREVHPNSTGSISTEFFGRVVQRT